MSDDRDSPPADAPASGPNDGYGARYADGKTAVIHEVQAQFGEDAVHLVDRTGREIAVWRYGDIRLTEPPSPDRPMRLQNLSEDMARIEIADREAVAVLRRLAPDLNKTGVRDPAQWRRAAFWTVTLGVIFGSIWWGISSSAPLVAAMIPIEFEERIGESTMDQVTLLFGGFKSADELTCNRAEGLSAMNSLTGRLSAANDTPYEFKVRVLDIDIPNAFAAPGGYIVVFRGLIDRAESPDEVAGVLAHEMGHVAHHHSMTHLIRSIGLQVLVAPLVSGGTMAADVVSQMGQAAMQASYSRELEAEADRAAVELMNRAGLKADGFTDLLQRIEREYADKSSGEGGPNDSGEEGRGTEAGRFSIPDMLATHPSTPDRAQRVRELASTGGEAGLDSAQWEALRSICDS